VADVAALSPQHRLVQEVRVVGHQANLMHVWIHVKLSMDMPMSITHPSVRYMHQV
jgi:hypothetical protein